MIDNERDKPYTLKTAFNLHKKISMLDYEKNKLPLYLLFEKEAQERCQLEKLRYVSGEIHFYKQFNKGTIIATFVCNIAIPK